MKEKIKKIASNIWNVWAAIAIFAAISALLWGLEQLSWFGPIIFVTLIILLALFITRKDREIIARQEERERIWKEKQKIVK